MQAKISKIAIAVTLCSMLLAGNAIAQNEEFAFHWAPSAVVDGDGNPLAEAVAYEVYVQRDADPDTLLATVTDTVFTLSAEPGIVQRLVVRAVDARGRFSDKSEASDPIYFEGIEQNRSVPSVPTTAELGPNYPNPFNPETSVVYGVPANIEGSETMHLGIYNIQGQLVRRLPVDPSPGWHEVRWDGKNEQGVVAATGMYLTRFTVGSMVKTSKMTMVK